MKNSKMKRIIIVLLAVLIVGGIIFGLTYSPSYKEMSYKDFNQMVDEGSVSNVIIESNRLIFCDAKGVMFQTDNPKSVNLKENLLLHGISVDENDGAYDIFYIVMDVFFDIVFVGFIVFGAYFVLVKIGGDFKVSRNTRVSFDDIAGMEQVKKDMMYLVDVLKKPREYASKGIRPVKGVVLEGPPGNGKTLFAKALSSEAKVGFIATKGADFQSAFMSVGSLKIKKLFRKAVRKSPCIIFIDEFDGIGERRNYAGTGIDKENNRIITALLNEMDGFRELEGVMVIAATNSYASLDKALVRPGRFDVKIKVPNPNKSTVMELIDIYTRNRQLDGNIDKEALAYEFKGMSCAAIESALNEAARCASMDGRTVISKDDIERGIRLVINED